MWVYKSKGKIVTGHKGKKSLDAQVEWPWGGVEYSVPRGRTIL